MNVVLTGRVGGAMSTSYSGSMWVCPVMPEVMIDGGSSDVLGVAALTTSPRW